MDQDANYISLICEFVSCFAIYGKCLVCVFVCLHASVCVYNIDIKREGLKKKSIERQNPRKELITWLDFPAQGDRPLKGVRRVHFFPLSSGLTSASRVRYFILQIQNKRTAGVFDSFLLFSLDQNTCICLYCNRSVFVRHMFYALGQWLNV